MCAQMLEGLAGQNSAGNSRQAAAWCLAAAAAAARMASRGAHSLQAGASGARLSVRSAAMWLSISSLPCDWLASL